VYVIVSVYIGIFLLSAVSLMLAGMSPFDAVNHAFSVVSTGGFSTRNMSVSYYGSMTINIIITFFMLLSSLHYGLIFTTVVTRSWRPVAKNPVVKYYFGSLIVMSFLIMLSLKVRGGYDSWGRAAVDSFFQVCSYLTTTGFGMSDNSRWPFMAGIVLLFASLQCGCSGSTSGGLKADRIYIAFKTLVRQMRSSLHPTAVSKVKVGGHYIGDSEALPILLYIVLYCTIIVIGIFLLMLCGVDVMDAISGAVSSMGNVGPGLGNLGALGTYASQPAAAKFIYTLGMILGRLEIYPVFMMFVLMFRREK
ncbi:MAG: hypothetical protein NC308_03635, partial [Clostridium sp.]|nr:hypothetical protein [Clostridium sp.]